MSITPDMIQALSEFTTKHPDIGIIVYNKKLITNRITLIKYIRKYMYYNLAYRARDDSEPAIDVVP